jgi:mRNA interferase YafQ
MRTIERTSAFKRDFKRVKTQPRHRDVDAVLVPVLQLLATDQAPPARLCDHALTGDWKDHRDCHLKPDLVLIYRKPEVEVLQLVRLGSHSDLGL